jgi:exopolyphosphatase / guanosine-5'-triphosphate,3'-diphosphate pyrophosphatase
MRTAVIGIGSNSVRMLVADVADGKARQILRDREGTRLFAGLDEKRNLSEESMTKTIEAVRRMASEARQLGAEQVDLFATSAVRDAANSDDLAARLKEKAQVELEICPGEEEAALSFLGATNGELCGVIDIGGGSTEIVVGQGENLMAAFSCQMGAVRLYGRISIHSHADLPAVRQLAADILEDKLREHPTLTSPQHWIGVGGTFTTLAAMVRAIHWTDRTYMHGTCITKQEIEQKAWYLSDMTLAERLRLPGLQPNRADIVVHGICILLAVMDRMNISEITVSEYGNLHGYLKKKYHIQGEIQA